MKRLTLGSFGNLAVLVALVFASGTAHANYLTAVIDALQAEGATNAGYVRLSGLPTFDGGGCTSVWATGDMDDQRFMIYYWPMLMAAKNQGKSVSVVVSGCSAYGYPRIASVQINPT
jgi:hypothetical protein